MVKRTYVENVQYNGYTYTGEMKGKKRDGQGTLTWNDGTQYQGEFKNNQLHGLGKMKFQNGNVYEGSFVKNNIHGHGTLITLNNETVRGFFQFKRRFITTDGLSAPVGEYILRVEVTTNSGVTKGYFGPATLHILTGLIVLPGMADSSGPVYDAVVIAIEHGDGKELEKGSIPVVEATHAKGSNSGGLQMGENDPSYQKEVKLKTKPVNW
eukprot:CAMPEP_0204848538 /NCGR_PEP_ID=MMETSP1347-20130617/4395_1 /ASSEMBLY_ACC=CAM_ASM_000690 /TAXON_ID=215587 /ORGANISM="Aplanochytrium stocchinoi, Strain GSBS06" /LENGTH=209 /DNA_ID=CAMNT_0051990177 /DNA_START=165 /DNA_END=791 /DNA_ORIENTATION=-